MQSLRLPLSFYSIYIRILSLTFKSNLKKKNQEEEAERAAAESYCCCVAVTTSLEGDRGPLTELPVQTLNSWKLMVTTGPLSLREDERGGENGKSWVRRQNDTVRDTGLLGKKWKATESLRVRSPRSRRPNWLEKLWTSLHIKQWSYL